ncbi:MAG: SurA N-terminal domain-containing protein [Pseudomonadota bacterium]
MLKSFRDGRSNIFVWILMGLLFVGLAGFGITTGGGMSTREVARVGDERVSAQDLARSLEQDLRALTAQTGQPFTMEQARAFGLDQRALLRLVNDAALDGEANRLGISVGDEAVREQLQQIGAFRTADGFSREAYLNQLNRIGSNPAEFEASIRDEIARALYIASVTAPSGMPPAATEVIVEFVGERRTFDWIVLTEADLPAGPPEPTQAEIRAFYNTHGDRYMRPEVQNVSYAIVSPATLAETVTIPDATLRAAYDENIERFQLPARRLLERIGFGTDAQAAEAMAEITEGSATFDEIAAERGLTPDDLDLGLLTASDLAREARDAVFGPDQPGIYGPVPSALGPSIYRVNGIFDAEETPFEEARAQIREQLALEEARDLILGDLEVIEDLIAGGARLDEIASETIMDLGSVEVFDGSDDPLAQDPAFLRALAGAREGEETDLVELSDGTYLTLRLDGSEPPAPIPFEDVEVTVADDWRAEELEAALSALAETLQVDLEGGASMADAAETVGADVSAEGPLTRSNVVSGVPPALIEAVFAAEDDGVARAMGEDGLVLAQVTSILPVAPDDPDISDFREATAAQFDLQVQDDLRLALVNALVGSADVRLNQSVIDATLEQFP